MIVMSKQSGAQIEIDDAPKITYTGTWMPWRPEFYGGVLYWEAWFLSSGTLKVTSGYSYTGDAWGIGGGAGADWSTSAGSLGNRSAGIPNMRTGITFTGDMSVTVGNGGVPSESSGEPSGGDTKLSDQLICAGASGDSRTVSDSYKRYRFEDPDKAGEKGNNHTANDDGTTYTAQGGWLPIRRSQFNSYSGIYSVVITAMGDGFGGAGCSYGWSAPGALVIRIPA